MTPPAIKLSIIIPVLNESTGLPACLQPLQMLRKQGAEVIVVDGGSDDDTLTVAQAFADKAFVAERGRARQMNAGAARAQGAYLLFLHADTLLPQFNLMSCVDSWLRRDVQWGFFSVRLSGCRWPLRIIERAISWRSRLTRVATGDQALFVSRLCWQAQQGFADVPLMEDIEFSKRLRQVATPNVVEAPVITDSRRWENRGIIKTVLLMWSLRLLYFFGVSPQRLAPRYGVDPKPRQANACIAQLAKAPVAGRVKTRMQPQLSADQAVQLHRLLVERVADNMSRHPACCFQLWVSDQPELDFFQRLQQRFFLRLELQQGNDLGQRMFHICQAVLQQYGAVILIGSDCPFVKPDHITQVLNGLAAGNQAVIIPADDGGYTVMALTQVDWKLFEGVQWGSDIVLQQTLSRLQELDWHYQCLAPLADIDRPEDLMLLSEDAATRSIVAEMAIDPVALV